MTDFLRLGVVSFAFGGMLILIGLVGGGLEIRELRFPQLGRATRGALGALGASFILLGVWVTVAYPPAPTDGNPEPPRDTPSGSPNGPSSSPTTPPVTPFPDPAEKALLSHIPQSMRSNCVRYNRTDSKGHRLPSVQCQPADGADFSYYTAFSNRQKTVEEYDAILFDKNLDRNVGFCRDRVPAENPTNVDGIPVGRLACYSDGARVWFMWFEDAVPILGQASRNDGDYQGLYRWWRQAGPD